MYTSSQLISFYDKKFRVNNFHSSPSGLYEPVNHIMSIKGKRIRPLLLLLSCDMFGGNVKQALNPAFAVEVFHNFTLVHDDIMDKAETRRGIPTVHKLYGINAGIIAGDVMLSYAYKYLTDVPAQFVPNLLDIFNKAAIEIFEGQQMDMDFENRTDVTEPEYLKMIEYKTSVLLGCCLQCGAILARADAKSRKLIYEFGIKLGLSFQIMDDYLDTFGEAEKVGKKIGGDILQNKKTHLFVSAMSAANKNQKKQLLKLLDETNESTKINDVKEIFEATKARQNTRARAEQFYNEALKAIKKISIKDSLKQPMLELAEQINGRQF